MAAPGEDRSAASPPHGPAGSEECPACEEGYICRQGEGCLLVEVFGDEQPAAHTDLREQFRPIIEAENALAQAIFLCDDLAEKQSNNHPEGNDFVTHYVVPHGLWAAVLREKQNLRHAFQTTLWPDLKDGEDAAS